MEQSLMDKLKMCIRDRFTRGQGGVGLCFVRRRHRRRRGRLSPAQHHRCPGQSGTAGPEMCIRDSRGGGAGRTL